MVAEPVRAAGVGVTVTLAAPPLTAEDTVELTDPLRRTLAATRWSVLMEACDHWSSTSRATF